jgi:hypothetical protein
MDTPPVKCPGGSVRIVDSTVFKGTSDIATAYMKIDPGAIDASFPLAYAP